MKFITISTVLAIIITICMFTGIPSTAVANPNQKDQSKYSNKIVPKDEIPFDDSVGTFSMKKTNSEINIYRAFFDKKGLFTKSEFESSDKFKERLETIYNKSLTGKLTFSSKVGFLSMETTNFKYDADKQQITITIPIYGIRDESVQNQLKYKPLPEKGEYQHFTYPRSIETLKLLTNKRNYTASNAYGAKIRVIATSYNIYQIAMRGNNTQLNELNLSLVLTIPMQPSDAIEIKKQGGVVIIGNLEYPFIGYIEDHYDPTITDPTEVSHRTHYLVIEPSEIWIVNKKNGKIYHKETIDNMKE